MLNCFTIDVYNPSNNRIIPVYLMSERYIIDV